MIGLDSCYAEVKQSDLELYENICAFASTFGRANEDIGLSTRYQVERFCMELVMRARKP